MLPVPDRQGNGPDRIFGPIRACKIPPTGGGCAGRAMPDTAGTVHPDAVMVVMAAAVETLHHTAAGNEALDLLR